jgi:predicted acetylornithine/succinylornithine family transaminase
MSNTKNLFEDYVLNTYNRRGPIFVKGKGSWLWDEQGKKYLDLFPGWGVSILGHCHPRIVKVLHEQAKNLIHLPNNLFFSEQAVLAKEIVKNTFDSKVFFSNSGAEANEGAIKLSRLYGKGTRHEIIVMKDSFHGRTFGALSATGQAKYKEPFKPILETFREVEFNNVEQIKATVNPKTVGILLELVQGEGGINPATRAYIDTILTLCRENDLLLMVDEVQTGMGRLGKLFAFELYGITPDIMTISKGLGAGVPIGAIVVNKRIADIIKPGMHASTFGGSPLVTRVSLEAFKIIKEEKLLQNVKKMGAYLKARLNKMRDKFSFIKEVRGEGLMLGVELECKTFPIFEEIFARGVIINSTHDTVLRIMPALNVTRKEIDHGLRVIEEVFKGVK